MRQLPEGYNAAGAQAGFLIDEWNEVIPNKIETTGHCDSLQPAKHGAAAMHTVGGQPERQWTLGLG